MNKQPLLIVTLCFILGILFQDNFPLGSIAVYYGIVLCVGILISLFFYSYFLNKSKPVLLCLLFFGLGIIFHFFNTFSSVTELTVREKETVIFNISQKLNTTTKYKKYEGVAMVGKNSFNTILYIPKDTHELDFKHYYKAEAYLARIKPPKYDFQFNYARYLKRKNIEYQCYLSKGISSAEKKGVSFFDRVKQQRLEILQRIDNTGMSEKAKTFLKGIILADRTEIDAETVRDFNRSGLIHLLAISGTHIVVIFGMFYFLQVRCIPLRLRRYAIIFSLVFIWLFAGFIGFGNSVLRSCMMLTIYFMYVLLQRKPDLLHALGLSAFIILVFDTRQFFDIGFQLSFLAVLGIFWLNQPLLNRFPKQDQYWKKLIFNTVTISIAAQLATLPLVLYYFHQFSLISVIANFIIVPFSEVIIVFSFLMTVLIAFKVDFMFINTVYDNGILLLLKVIHWFAEVDVLFFENIPVNLMEVVSMLGVVYLLRAVILHCNFKSLMRLSMSVFVFFIIRTGSNVFENQREEVLFHDFNTNKVFLVKNGNKACFWISDISDQEKVIRYFINPYCSSRRIVHFEIKSLPPSVRKIVFQDHIYEIK
ncbi:ComEC/Rec2 family competence protein [Chryseobacterium sp. Bi04]|uniref:ComEC/Rec2 family competence protein n=1 Tax=Chryseobacterium sp. Bi04 TaxID=2822345 RepID=UPI001E417AC3|nr:ComEC/Rec2 family competence protein [Chryseobacterium sp. Bi04]